MIEIIIIMKPAYKMTWVGPGAHILPTQCVCCVCEVVCDHTYVSVKTNKQTKKQTGIHTHEQTHKQPNTHFLAAVISFLK